MSIEETNAVNELLRATQGSMREGGWPERRAGMEASLSGFPLAEGVICEPATLGGVPAEWQFRTDATDKAAILYVHGGGYCVGSIATHRPLTTQIAAGFAGRVVSLDYRLAPEHLCPAAIDDTVSAYRALLDRGIAAGRIVIAGDSAGGGLTVAAMMAIRDAGLPLPAGGWVISPWVDLTGESETLTSKAEVDLIITASALNEFAAAYAPDGNVLDARATPLNGAFDGLPPLMIQVGTSEGLLGDSIALAGKASAADVSVTLQAWPNQQHVWHMFAAMLGEAREAIGAGVAWANTQVT
jgi:acetyl esterase/lipase